MQCYHKLSMIYIFYISNSIAIGLYCNEWEPPSKALSADAPPPFIRCVRNTCVWVGTAAEICYLLVLSRRENNCVHVLLIVLAPFQNEGGYIQEVLAWRRAF